MAVYVDRAFIPYKPRGYRTMKMCHLLADSAEELFVMARAIGMAPKWFQPWSHPHFDVSTAKRKKALQLGAIEVDRKGSVDVMKRYRNRLFTDPAERETLEAFVKKFGADPTGKTVQGVIAKGKPGR